MKEEGDYNVLKGPASLYSNYRCPNEVKHCTNTISWDLTRRRNGGKCSLGESSFLRRIGLVKKERGCWMRGVPYQEKQKSPFVPSGVAKRSRLFEEIVSTDDLKWPTSCCEKGESLSISIHERIIDDSFRSCYFFSDSRGWSSCYQRASYHLSFASSHFLPPQPLQHLPIRRPSKSWSNFLVKNLGNP